MDKNTIIGFVLMAFILIAMTWINQPTQEQLEARKRYQDSISQVEMADQIGKALAEQASSDQKDALIQKIDTITSDSIKQHRLYDLFGDFANGALGQEELVTLENEVLELQINNRGGQLHSARLKNYQTHDSLPLFLFNDKEASLNMSYITANNKVIYSNDLYFQPLPVKKENDKQILTMRLVMGNDSYLDHVYTIEPDNYMISFAVIPHNIIGALSSGMNTMDIEWKAKLRQQEKGRKFEERYTGLYYKLNDDNDVEHLSESKNEQENVREPLKWLAYKDQYFSTVFIADQSFASANLSSTIINQTTSPYLKEFASTISVDFNAKQNQPLNFRFYLGPNHYPTLRAYDKDVEKADRLEIQKLVPLGASIFRWVNKIFVIPMFNFLDNYISNFGIIILIMTLVVKLILFPLTYKSFMSTAKMRVLRPQVEAINERLKGDDKAMQRQQATMELYSRAGVSPMSGCLPMLLQMPVLIALFMFFPAAIELRQQSFLWAHDLSTYDAVLNWETHIPFISNFYGNHVSLFCLLMTIVNITYTKFNMEMSNTGQEQMPGMKWMMYFMPVMFLFFFNQYASGLTYYYLLSTLISILQTMAFRKFINEEKLLAKLEANKKRPVNKNGFMARLAEAQKQQQELMRQQQNERNKRKK